jgi:hypothetical protein
LRLFELEAASNRLRRQTAELELEYFNRMQALASPRRASLSLIDFSSFVDSAT